MADKPPFGLNYNAEDGLSINASPGRAITYYTYNDNRTNDPTLVVSPAEEVNVMLQQLPNQ